jgi:Xaa-Pro aminopeptidase
VAYAYVVFTQDSCTIFVDQRKLNDDIRTIWAKDDVAVQEYGVAQVGDYVRNRVKAIQNGNEKLKVKVFAPKECSWALYQACSPVCRQYLLNSTADLQSDVDILQPCPVDVLKGVKNGTEIEGARNAYLRDGRAMVRWMAWLEQKILQDGRPVGEWVAAQGLLRYRKLEENFA